MAIYNCAPTLKEAIDSLYAQTYNNFKLVLCDDASTDNTYEIAKQYAEKHDNIVLIQNEKNMKLAYSLNRCLEYADTEYVARMDGDDISLPTRFEKQIKFLDNHPEYAVVSCPMIYFDETGDWGFGKSNPTPDKNSFKKGPPHAHAPSMVRTAVMNEVKGYTVSNRLTRGQDYYLWYKIYKAGYQGYNLQEHLYKMRDDKNAMARRTFRHAYNFYFIRKEMFDGLEISYTQFNLLMPLLKQLVPSFIKKHLRKSLKS